MPSPYRGVVAGRRINLGLLVLTVAALGTGGVLLGTGSSAAWWVALLHGVTGLGLLALVPGKTPVATRGLRRRNRGRWSSVVLGVLLAVTVVTGVLHSAGLTRVALPNMMHLHIGAALLALPVFGWHVVARPVAVRHTDLDRRVLMRAGGVLGLGALAWGVVEAGVRLGGTRGADRRGTGSHEVSGLPVTQWLDDQVQRLDADAWRLTVVDRDGSRELTAADLAAMQQEAVDAVLDCTGGWWARRTWSGPAVRDLLLPTVGDRSIVVTSVTGYRRRLPLRDLPLMLLATAVAGEALSAAHGAPARLVVPGRRGFWWVKWVARIETSPHPWWWQSPFPLT